MTREQSTILPAILGGNRGPFYFPEPAGSDDVLPPDNQSEPDDQESPDNGEEKLRAQGLKALQDERQRSRKLEAELKAMKAKMDEVDLEEFKKLKKEKEQEATTKEQTELEQKKQYQEALSKRDADHKKEQETLRQQIETLRKSMEEDKIVQAIQRSFIESGGRKDKDASDYVAMMMPLIRQHLKVENDRVIVADANGDQRVNPDNGFADFSLNDLMEECRKGAASIFFEPRDNASGAGATGNGRRSNAALQKTMQEINSLPRSERILRARELGI